MQGTPTGINTINFTDTTGTPYAANNNVTVTINFTGADMPSNDDTRSFTVIGSANPQII